MTSKELLLLRAIRKEPVERTPIWIMRQAGRYLPEYRALREKYDFLTVCKTPELAAEVTLQPVRRFGFDAAILFSDILVIPEALGQTLEFLEDHGPKLSPAVRTEKEIETLSTAGLTEKLDFVAQAVRLIRQETEGKTALIGFSGSPFTLTAYMIEGKPTRHFKHIKTMLYTQPEVLHRLLQILTAAVTDYLKMQIEAGAQVVQIFDTWGSILPVHLFEEFSARYLNQIAADLQALQTPVIVFSMGGMDHLVQLADSPAQVLGVDWSTDFRQAYKLFGDEFALQGNLDPTVLYGDQAIIRREVERVLSVFGAKSGHIFNLGHGILPDIPLENVQFLVEEVRRQSEQFHRDKK